ncbi:MAG: shikimate kinase [Alistipes sp.]|jgi:shikimate kinase|nr:shikimate kinase [Alistipes sp.]
MARRIFLTGFMGSGKSSLGRRLASELRWKLIDTDREIERRAGMTIPEIFERRGEEAFRELESRVIDDAAASEHDTVVALGGGAVCREGVMEMLAGAGQTIYLKMSAARLVGRMSPVGRAKRPKIAGMGDAELTAFIEKTLPEREKYYNRATFVLDCGDASDGVLLRMMLQHINNLHIE